MNECINENSITGFVAFPSYPPALAETVEEGIQKINDTGLVKLLTWTQMRTGGKLIISEICKQIDNSDLFIGDITNQNVNVLFELGYAIAREKRIWLLQDCSTDNARDRFEKVGLLKSIGYIPYTNSSQIYNKFLEERPYADLGTTPFEKYAKSIAEYTQNNADILYLKCFTPTEASVRLAKTISRIHLKSIIDDPSEKSQETLDWYIRHIYGTHALLIHLDSDNVSDAAPTNAKYSFIAGFAYGLGKDILLLAHEPYSPPMDYESLLKKHDTASLCVQQAEPWLEQIYENIKDSRVIQRSIHETQGKPFHHGGC